MDHRLLQQGERASAPYRSGTRWSGRDRWWASLAVIRPRLEGRQPSSVRLGKRASPTAEELRGRPVAIRAGDYPCRFSARRGRGPEEFQLTERERHSGVKCVRPRLDSLGISGCSFGDVVFEPILGWNSERLAWRRIRPLRWTRLNEERLVRPTPMAVRGVGGAGRFG
jgi:hypothetical protein